MKFREEVQVLNSWAVLISRYLDGYPEPFVHFRTQDYVAIVAVNKGRIALVKQYRVALDIDTTELPSGLIEPGQSALAAAKRELEEEAGLIPTSEPIALPMQYIDSARLETRLYPFLFKSTEEKVEWLEEEGIERQWLAQDDIENVLNSGLLSLSSHGGILAYLKMTGAI